MICPNCNAYVSWRYKRCPVCSRLLEKPDHIYEYETKYIREDLVEKKLKAAYNKG